MSEALLEVELRGPVSSLLTAVWKGCGIQLRPVQRRVQQLPLPSPLRKRPVQQAAPRGRTEGTGQGAGTERCGPPGAAADGSWAEQGSLAASSLCSTFSA